MNNKVKRIVLVAVFSALTTLLYIFVKFPLPIFPTFLDVNISMIPVIICAFVLGPVDASVCVIIRCLIKLPMSSTAYVGELADLIMGLGTCIPCGIIYKFKFKHKTIVALLSVVFMWVGLGIITNIYINIPFYTDFYFGGSLDGLLGMCSDAFRLISFGNMVCYTICLRAIHQTQLNPTISYLHTPGERRYSLALDIAEIFKPIIVDRVIFKVLNRKEIQEKHFDRKLNKCLLNTVGKKIFVKAIEDRLGETIRHRSLHRPVSYRHLVKLECYKLAKHLLSMEEYKPFKMYW